MMISSPVLFIVAIGGHEGLGRLEGVKITIRMTLKILMPLHLSMHRPTDIHKLIHQPFLTRQPPPNHLLNNLESNTGRRGFLVLLFVALGRGSFSCRFGAQFGIEAEAFTLLFEEIFERFGRIVEEVDFGGDCRCSRGEMRG
jgi:hypothetical protein